AAVLPACCVEPGPLPAYFVPATPGFVVLSLNAEPGALPALPGSVGAVAVAQLNPCVVPGCPVVGFCMAPAIPAGASAATIATPPIPRLRRILDITDAPSRFPSPGYTSRDRKWMECTPARTPRVVESRPPRSTPLASES